jgi:hypothetical protein
MAGSGIIPAVGTLLRAVVKRLEHGDGQRRFELLQESSESRAHDPGTDEDDVRLTGVWISIHGHSTTIG